MGRTARYKKVKACDPFSKQNSGRNRVSLDDIGVWGLGDSGRRAKKRSRTASRALEVKIRRREKSGKRQAADFDGFDLPATKDDFDMNDLVGSLKKESPEESLPSDANIDAVGKDKYSKMVAIEKSTNGDFELVEPRSEKDLEKLLESAESEKKADRNEGESKRAYRRRVKSETRAIINKEKRGGRNMEKFERRKEFLKQKKRKRSGGPFGEGDQTSNFTEETGGADSHVPFGEQAERPPSFHMLPTHAAETKRRSNATTSTPETDAAHAGNEKIRQAITTKYALMKAKRRRQNEFHL